MKRKVWNLRLDDNFHTVTLEHGVWSGERTISVDGQVVEKARELFGTSGRYSIKVAGHPGSVIIRSNGFTYIYDLVVDGRSLRTGLPAAPQPESPAAAFPAWGWAFVAACAAIPLLSAGGALPLAIGVGGATACAGMVRDEARSEVTRLFLCLSVTLLCWVLSAGAMVGSGALPGGPLG